MILTAVTNALVLVIITTMMKMVSMYVHVMTAHFRGGTDMGLTIYSKHLSHDLGSGGFYRLRKTIAKLCPDDIQTHYMLLADHYHDIQVYDPGFHDYDTKTERLYQKNCVKYGKIIDFLWASDLECKLTYGTAGQLLHLIGDYDDNIIYGYAGWGDKAMRFHHFKEILTDAYQSKSKWGWK